MILNLILITGLDTFTAKTETLFLSNRRLSLSDVIRNIIAKIYAISHLFSFWFPIPYMDRALPYKEVLRPPQLTINSGMNPLVRFGR